MLYTSSTGLLADGSQALASAGRERERKLKLRKYVLYLWLCFATSVVVVVANLSRLGGARRRVRCTHGVARWWARGVLRVSGACCRIEGLEHIEGSGPFVIVSNHRSHMDTPLLIAHLPFLFGFIVKRELMRIPVFAGAMKAIGCVAVSRRRSREDHAVLDGVAVEVAGGKSILVFAEGRRSPTDEMMPFKKGATVLALKAGVPILPVAVSGTNRVIPLEGGTVIPGPLLLRIGSPIVTKGLGMEARESLNEEVRAAVIGLYQPAYTGESLEEIPCDSAQLS